LRGPVLLIFLTVFLDLLGVGILLPVLPYVVREYRPDALTVGLVNVGYSLAQFLMTPVLGALSDRYGRRPVLLISLFGTAVGYVMFGLANSLALILCSRILDGITGGNISTAQAYLADITPPENRARSFGLIGAAFGLGFLMGPAIGGFLATFGLRAPAYGAAGLALTTMVLAYFFLPESLPPERRGPVSWNGLNPLRQIAGALQRPAIRSILLATFLFTLAYSQLQSHFAVYSLTKWGLNERQNAVYLTYLGFMAVLMQGFLIRQLTPVFGERKLSIFGMGLGMGGFLVTALAPEPWYLFVALTFLAAGSGLVAPSLTALVSQRSTPAEQGWAMGVSQSMASLARVVGPLQAGLLFDALAPAAPYWAGAAIMLVALYLLRLALLARAPA